MSYHNIPSSAIQSATNAQGQTAPAGYHYMPDGSLMSDAEHTALYGAGVIKDIPASGEPVFRQAPLKLSPTMDLTNISTTEIKRLIREIQTIPKENDELYLVYRYLVTTLWKRQQL